MSQDGRPADVPTEVLDPDYVSTRDTAEQQAIDESGIDQPNPNPNWIDFTPSTKPHDPTWMCRAHRNSDGELCRKPAIKGATVCLTHGGSAKHVREAAKARLQSMVPKALDRLEALAGQGEHLPTAMRAVETILDRGIGPVKTGTAVALGVAINIPRWAADGSQLPTIDVSATDESSDD